MRGKEKEESGQRTRKSESTVERRSDKASDTRMRRCTEIRQRSVSGGVDEGLKRGGIQEICMTDQRCTHLLKTSCKPCRTSLSNR